MHEFTGMSNDLAHKLTEQKLTWLQAILESALEVNSVARQNETAANRSGSYASLLWGEGNNQLEAFRHSVLRLLTRTDQVLTLSAIESGLFELHKTDFDVKTVLSETLETFNYSAQAKQGILKANISPAISGKLVGDPLRLRQSLGALLEHAVRFTKAPQIEVSITASDAEKNCLKFCVSDSGDGVAEASPELSFCRRILKAMGSELITHGHSNGVNSFSFDISYAPDLRKMAAETGAVDVSDFAKAECPTPTKAEQASPTGDAIDILIVEDSEDSRFLLQEFLKKGPYELTFAENGKVAVETATTRTFDLILMDIQMPVMDGLTATRLIRDMERQQGRAKTPLLALTSNARKSDIELSMAAGCDAHVLKPISKMELLNTVRKFAPIHSAPEAATLVELNIPTGLEDAAKRYISSKIEDIPLLMRYLESGNFEQLRILAHDIKGIGTSYGFPNLTWLAGQIECAAREENSSDLSNRMLELFRYTKDAAQMMST